MKKAFLTVKGYVPVPAIVSFVLFFISAILYAIACVSRTFADALNSTVSVALRYVLGAISSILPFSLFELLLVLIVPILVIVVVFSVRAARSRRSAIRFLCSVLCVLSLIATSYIYTLGVGYRTTELSEKLGLDTEDAPSTDDLYAVSVFVRDQVNELSSRVTYSDGEGQMEYSMLELSRKISCAYAAMNGEYSLCADHFTRAKPIVFSTVMSDAGITGIYSFFTGECNINMEYPDYNLPFTVAHEFAHARGFGRENEANFLAFLVCTYSDDDFVRYSGFLNLYGYLSSALYRADPELYKTLHSELSLEALGDMRLSAAVSAEHSGSLLGKINDKANDLYLKSNGTDGVVSYGYVVELAVAYYSRSLR